MTATESQLKHLLDYVRHGTVPPAAAAHALFDAGLIEVSKEWWRTSVSLTAAGRVALVGLCRRRIAEAHAAIQRYDTETAQWVRSISLSDGVDAETLLRIIAADATSRCRRYADARATILCYEELIARESVGGAP